MTLNTVKSGATGTEGLHIACGLLLLRLPWDWVRSGSESFVGFVVLPLVVITLTGFVYAVCLKKPLRARHIRVLREKRELREAAERGRARR